MRCKLCNGSGKKNGMGMMMVDCDCETGDESDVPVRIDKRSKAYKEAVDKIMNLYDVSREEAAKTFEEEFSKIA